MKIARARSETEFVRRGGSFCGRFVQRLNVKNLGDTYWTPSIRPFTGAEVGENQVSDASGLSSVPMTEPSPGVQDAETGFVSQT